MKESKYNREDKIKHLEFILTIINRLSQNSFLIKGWTLTISLAIIAYSSNKDEKYFQLIALTPIILFWILDSIFLRNEKYFRELYDFIRMSDEDHMFAMKVDDSIIKKTPFLKSFFNPTMIMFYLAVIITLFSINLIEI